MSILIRNHWRSSVFSGISSGIQKFLPDFHKILLRRKNTNFFEDTVRILQRFIQGFFPLFLLGFMVSFWCSSKVSSRIFSEIPPTLALHRLFFKIPPLIPPGSHLWIFPSFKVSCWFSCRISSCIHSSILHRFHNGVPSNTWWHDYWYLPGYLLWFMYPEISPGNPSNVFSGSL